MQITIGENFSFYSEILNENRNVFISLPESYQKSKHEYPVIFVLDAEYLFEITNSIVKIKASRNEMPESILVGIPNLEDKRYDMAMDLSYPNGDKFFGDSDGKAIKSYLNFFKQELIPHLEQEYRVNNHRTIIGMSPTFGPVLESFWNQPDLFQGHIVLAAELALLTSNGKTVAERVLQTMQDETRPKGAIYIGKADDDLKRRPKEEALAYDELNQILDSKANPNIVYKIEVLEDENHYGMSISGIEHGLETIYPFDMWNVPYRDFWDSDSPAQEIKSFYDNLSDHYGFEIVPLEDSFYAAQTLTGTIRRLERMGRQKESNEIRQLATEYYPRSSRFSTR